MIVNKNIQCTSCGMCEAVCKKESIKVCVSSEGYYRPFINNDKCNKCGLCEAICPAYGKIDFAINRIFSFAAYSKDEETRTSCSSGGLGFEIAKLMLNKGYRICGVVYDVNTNIAKHIICDEEKDLEKIKGSKYIQSYSVEAFREVIKKIDDKKYVVFGTPCQIAAIDKYARLTNKRDDYLLVDFFCHGTPSFLLWQSYIGNIQKNKAMTFFDEVKFRDKKYGWHNFTISIKSGENVFFSDKRKDKDLFYEFFLGNFCLNEACYTCIFRGVKSRADIRLGDLWGTKYAADKKGVSGLIAFTKRGRETINDLDQTCYVCEESLGGILEGQMEGDICIPIERKYILKDFSKEKSLKYIYNRRILFFKIKIKVKMLLNKILRLIIRSKIKVK